MSTAEAAPPSFARAELIFSRFLVATVVVFAALAVVCAALSDGFVAADACTHYLFAKYAFADPVNLVDVWGRPLCTLSYAVPAQLAGRLGVRVTSVAIAIGCAMVAVALARGQKLRNPELAALFTLGAPLFFLYSFAEMTELPFALLLGAALLAYQRGRFFSMALLAGLLPTARPEGFGIVLLAAVGLLLHRRWLALLILPLPLLIWDGGGWIVTARAGHWWMWLLHAWPWSQQNGYGRGSILSFVTAMPLVVPPLVLPATIAGICLYLFPRNRERMIREGEAPAEPRDPRLETFGSAGASPSRPCDLSSFHLRVCAFLIAAIPLTVLIFHSLVRWSGIFATLGEPRYLLITAPLWGILSARGWEWAFQRLQWKHAIGWAVPAVCLPGLVNLVYPIVPVHLTDDWRTARQFAELYRSTPLHEQFPHVIASHVGIYYFLGIDPTSGGHQDSFSQWTIANPPPGAVLIWDPIFSTSNANARDTSNLADIAAGIWREDPQLSHELGHGWHVFKEKPRHETYRGS